jgi:hypothetical protein
VGTAEEDVEPASPPASASSPSRRRGRNGNALANPTAAVAVAVVPNTPQRQPRALRAGLPFRLRLFVTGPYTPRNAAPASSSLPSAPGRPCVPALLEAWAKAAEKQEEGKERLGLVVCGPQGMAAEARHWAVGRRAGSAAVDLHEEVFHW